MAQQEFTFVIAFFLAIIVVVIGQVNCDLPAGFERCDETAAFVGSFYVKNCPLGATTRWPCKLTRGRPFKFELEFTSPKDYNQANMHLDVTHASHTANVCSSSFLSGLRCPGKKGHWHNLIRKVDIDETLAGALESDIMKFYLTDAETNELLLCIKFPIQVKQ